MNDKQWIGVMLILVGIAIMIIAFTDTKPVKQWGKIGWPTDPNAVFCASGMYRHEPNGTLVC